MKRLWFYAFGLLLLAVFLPVGSYAQPTFKVLYNFDSHTCDPLNPVFPGAIVQGRDGNFYTTSFLGGCNANGTIFRMSPAGALKVLTPFPMFAGGPGRPKGGATMGTDGNFYGTNSLGPAGFAGTLFKTTPAGLTTTAFTFGGTGNPPGFPAAAPVQAADGNLYGTLVQGGVGCLFESGGCGGIYKYSPATGKTTILFTFPANQLDGATPGQPLVAGIDGNLYGTANGGANGDGVVFKITPAGQVSVVHKFCQKAGCVDGSGPSALIQGADGNFYGTTTGGGVQKGSAFQQGVIYKLTPGGGYSVLWSFCQVAGCTDGAMAGIVGGNLVQANDGKLYGVTPKGGGACFATTCGVIWSFNPTVANSYSVVFSPNVNQAFAPAGLMQATDGNFYGDSQLGGMTGPCNGNGCGTFFKLSTGLKPFVRFVQSQGKVGAQVQILGQGFTTSTTPITVSFNGIPVVFQTSGDHYMTTTVPAGATTGPITVTTSAGTLTSNTKFRVTPQLTTFAPTAAPVAATVKITGVSLLKTTSVTIGGAAATFVINSDTQVTATVPAAAKTGTITVTTTGGTVTSTTTFTVQPAITSFTPTSGPVGTPVTITGTTFTGASSITFNGTTSKFTLETSTQISANVPPGATTGKIAVITPAGTGTSSTSFTVTVTQSPTESEGDRPSSNRH
ncbi:MAG TPA: choice-of-anchor tandem repeat GloVer-containing protein [Candidatus Sulfotelmatobacter sp.]|nr:choice-of-anchor tandem repeat GloVer-containing protein [Candidatus Sulfotelmatobacter sp.]